MEIIEWITAHKAEIAEAFGALWLLVSIVVRITPTPKDDEALSKVRAFLERVSFLAPQSTGRVLSLPGSNPRGQS